MHARPFGAYLDLPSSALRAAAAATADIAAYLNQSRAKAPRKGVAGEAIVLC